MKRHLIIRPKAEVDIMNAVLWYEQRKRGLGNEVMSEIRSAIKRALALTQKSSFIGFGFASCCEAWLGPAVSEPRFQLGYALKLLH